MNFSNQQMNNIFAYLNSRQPEITNPRYRETENLVYGEEQQGYYAIPGEERNLIVDRFADIKTLSNKITTQLYQEPRYGDLVKGLYSDIITAREQNGKLGIRGMNKRGMLCACLIIILVSHGILVDLDSLIKAANKVNTKTAKSTPKMVLRYLNFIFDLLNEMVQNTRNDMHAILKKHLRKTGIDMGYSGRSLQTLLRKADNVDNTVLSYHTPHIISAAIIYHNSQPSLRSKEFVQKLGVSQVSLKKALLKLKFINHSSIPLIY